MKKIFNIFIGIVAMQFLACSSPEEGQQNTENVATTSVENTTPAVESSNNTSSSAKIEIVKEDFDFGTITQGEKVEHTFTFKNVGGSPLIVTGATASCGCTTPEFSNHPIAPGEEGMIKVVFDSEGQIGKQHKVIIVTSNAENNMVQFHLRGAVNQKN